MPYIENIRFYLIVNFFRKSVVAGAITFQINVAPDTAKAVVASVLAVLISSSIPASLGVFTFAFALAFLVRISE